MVTNTRLKVSGFGVKCLKIFLFTVTILVVAAIISAFYMLPDKWVKWLVIVLAFSAADFLDRHNRCLYHIGTAGD